MKRCRHLWVRKVASFGNRVKFGAGELNYWTPSIEVEVCVKCHKVRNVKKSRRTGKR